MSIGYILIGIKLVNHSSGANCISIEKSMTVRQLRKYVLSKFSKVDD